MRRVGIHITIYIVFAGLIGLLFYQQNKPKVAVVRSQYLLENYVGMIEADQALQQKSKGWEQDFTRRNKDLDSLKNMLEKNGSDTVLLRKYYSRGMELEKLRRNMLEKGNSEKEKLLEGVLNQVNSYIKNYGKTHGYQVVLGITGNGNVLYCEEAVDVTEDVLKGLNNQYLDVKE